jgi:hypothetical protein
VPDTANLSIEAKAENATVNATSPSFVARFGLAHGAWHVLAIPHIEFLDESRNVRPGFLEPDAFAKVHTALTPAVYADVGLFGFITG